MIKKLLLLTLTLTSFISFSQEGYYDDVDLNLTGIELKDALSVKITATHTNFLYYSDVWEASKITDQDSDPSRVVLIYGWEDGSDQDDTNDRTRDNSLQDTGSGASFRWNREHVFPKSLANPKLNTDEPGPATDAHHLRAADRGRNSSRSNRKFGRGSGNSDFSTVDFHQGNEGPNTAAWYPGDEWKGDVARMMMYMYLRYGSVCLPSAVGVGSNDSTPDDMIDLFLVWNVDDPVSDFEKTRNTYHENTNNSAAQGNRNPFIDNPFLATRIWGGDSAQDIWGIYTTNDNEAPTVPTNVTISNQDFTSFDVSWDASDDNESVTGYDIFVDGILAKQTSNATVVITALNPDTTYSITILAKDLVNNKSEQSASESGTTLTDSEAPAAPTNLEASGMSDSSFTLSWEASLDNNEIAEYNVYVDGSLVSTVTTLSEVVNGLTASTDYTAYIIAKDTSDNLSQQSSTVNISTTAGGTGVAAELFISEYVEPEGGNNKAIEIVNLTGSTIDLAGYELRRNPSGGSEWSIEINLDSGDVKTITPGDVFVVTHGGADDAFLVAQSDLQTDPNIENGAPLSFNGDDPVGLFKNDVLIDIVGEFNGGNGVFAQDATLRRNGDVTGPNTTFSQQNDWASFTANTFDGIGSHTSTLSTNDALFNTFKIYPNPTNGNKIYFNLNQDVKVTIYNVLGKLIQTENMNANTNSINISTLSKGMYILKINSENQFITKKIIKN